MNYFFIEIFFRCLQKRTLLKKMVVAGGYDVEGEDAIPAKYECQIYLLILRQPVQTLCGHRFCRVCLNSLYDQ